MFVILCSDGETFISADDLRINLWNLEISNQSFNIVDVKPANMEDLTGEKLSLSLSFSLFLYGGIGVGENFTSPLSIPSGISWVPNTLNAGLKNSFN